MAQRAKSGAASQVAALSLHGGLVPAITLPCLLQGTTQLWHTATSELRRGLFYGKASSSQSTLVTLGTVSSICRSTAAGTTDLVLNRHTPPA